jgi:hypothetical protein
MILYTLYTAIYINQLLRGIQPGPIHVEILTSPVARIRLVNLQVLATWTGSWVEDWRYDEI